MADITPVLVKDTRVYLAGGAGGFDVRDCPNAEQLASKIGLAVNANDALVAALVETRAFIDNDSSYGGVDDAISKIDAALALARKGV